MLCFTCSEQCIKLFCRAKSVACLVLIKRYDHCLHDLHLYIQKMLTYREMVNFQKWDFFRFFYTFTINCVTTGAQTMPIEYICFALLVANNA